MRILLLTVAGGILLGSLLAQPAGPPTSSLFTPRDPADNPTTPEKVLLGQRMFESPLLSAGGQVSCQSCHDPRRGFSDARQQSIGIGGFPVGRNGATLLVAGLVERFPGQKTIRSKDGRRVLGVESAVLNLEERCLAPIENAVEMGTSVRRVVRRLRREPGLNKEFDAAFGTRSEGVTVEKLGKVLAAYLRSLSPRRSAPYRRYLEGDAGALSAPQRRGLRIFNGRGRCNRCHSGPALTDGLVHLVALPGSARQVRTATALRNRFQRLVGEAEKPGISKERRALLRKQIQVLGGQGAAYYGPTPQVGAQTPTLWGLAQTAPYFRDGSVQDMEEAVKTHIEEIQEVHLTEEAFRPRITAPSAIVASGVDPLPDDLEEEELADLMAFLRSL